MKRSLVILFALGLQQCIASDYSEIAATFEKRFEALENDLSLQTSKLNEQEWRIQELERLTEDQRKVIAQQTETLADHERRLKAAEDMEINDENRLQRPIGQVFWTEDRTGVQQPSSNINDSVDIPNTLPDQAKLWREVAVNSNLVQNSAMDRRSLRSAKRQSEIIAFTATLAHKIVNLGADQPIVFDTVITNEGNHYNPHTGIFTAPMPGMYAFNFHIATYRVHVVWVSLVVDGRHIVQAVADGTTGEDDIQGGNFAILKLEAGDSVWINTIGAGQELWAAVDQSFDSFSGFQLF